MRHKFAYYAHLLLVVILAISLLSCACRPGPAIQWSKTFDGGSGNSVQQTTDNGYIVCGTTNGDVWLIKTNADGNKLWDKIFPSGNEWWSGRCCSVEQTTEGGYIICGTTEYYGAGDGDVWLIKTDADGNKLWDKTFGGKNPDLGGQFSRPWMVAI